MLQKYDAKLNELREKMLRRGKVESMLSELRRQRSEAAAREEELRRDLEREQADVDRLSRGLMSIYYTITGKKEDMLENERAEVLKALEAYNIARQERMRIDEQIEQLIWELRDMDNAADRYRETLDEKLDAMRAAGIAADKILPIEEKICLLQAKLREIEQAQTAGRRVIGQMDTIENELSEAENYGRADLFGMSSVITQIGKYAHFDTAKQHTQKLKQYMSEFQKELSDVTVQAEVFVEIDGFTRFADWFFDGLFADWAALQRVQESKSSVRTARIQIERVLDRLLAMKQEIEQKIRQLQRELYVIAENTK